MLKLEVTIPDKDDTIIYKLSTPKEAYALIKHHRLPYPDAALLMQDGQLWSVSINMAGVGWKLKRVSK